MLSLVLFMPLLVLVVELFMFLLLMLLLLFLVVCCHCSGSCMFGICVVFDDTGVVAVVFDTIVGGRCW